MNSLYYSLDETVGSPSVEIVKGSFNYPCSSVDTYAPYEVTFKRGNYIIECWGAGSAGSYGFGGRGAYTKGLLRTYHNQKLYLHIGASLGKYNSVSPEAITKGGCSGNGATDIRLSPLPYYEFDSLKT